MKNSQINKENDDNLFFEKKGIQIIVVSLLMLICIISTIYFHYYSKTENVFTHLYYFPGVLAVFWFHKKGIFVSITLALLLIFSHIYFLKDYNIINDVFRAFSVVVISFVFSFVNKRIVEDSKKILHLYKNVRHKNKELVESEKELRLVKNKLEINEKRLIASNAEKLRTANQQLEANNQQLMLSERALMKEKLFVEKIVETASAIIIGLDCNHIIRIFNKGAEKITGYKKEEVIDKDWIDIFVHDDIVPNIKNVWKEAWGNTSHSSINPILTKSGEERIISWQNTGIYNSPDVSKNLLIAIGQDITERTLAEKTLAESEEKFRTLAQTSPMAIMLYQKEKWIYSNPAGERISGYTFAELKKMNFWDFVAPEYQDLIRKRGKGREQGIQSGTNYEFKIITKSGQEKWVLLNGSSINIQGVFSGFITVLDISERKKIEKDLKEALIKAQESDKLKSAFLANMSHEIRTPMNGILGFTNLLNDSDLTGKQKHKYVEIIKKSGERMLNTVNNIVDISKIDAGQIKISNSIININEELENQFEFFNGEATAKGINMKLISTIPFSDSYIYTDKVKLNSIISNLIKNAIKYTDKGSIKILSYKNGERFEFKIIDTGIGIPPNRINSIFNRFEQADISDTHARQGSGLGLSITKAYVEILGGSISVLSETNKGSVFHITIPWVNKPKQVENEIVSNQEMSNSIIEKRISILIAEDDEISYEHLRLILKPVASKIHRAENGIDAIKYLKKNPDVNLVLMDINMPLMGGYEATKEIRSFNKDVILIAQTAYAFSKDREKVLKIGCNDYISKPIDRRFLIKLLYKYFGKRRIVSDNAYS